MTREHDVAPVDGRTGGADPRRVRLRRDPRSGSHVVACVIADGLNAFEMAVACEVFGLERPELGVPWYRFVVCAADPEPVRTNHGFSITAAGTLADVVRADTVIVPGWKPNRPVTPTLAAALVAAHRRGARLMSFCSGAFALAATGLLDGRRMTTHWMYAETLAARYPQISVDPRVLYVDDGDILTSAGTAAGIDLSLHVVRQDYGAEIANLVARRMVVPPHRSGGQAQFTSPPVPECTGPDAFGETLEWAAANLGEPITIEALAARAYMSPRTFARRFKLATGTTPLQWLLNQRIHAAQGLLESSDESIERIAARCGFGTAANLRLHFQRALATSPLAYRRTFRRTSA
jgi:AraC family transcriptional activator FtrA